VDIETSHSWLPYCKRWKGSGKRSYRPYLPFALCRRHRLFSDPQHPSVSNKSNIMLLKQNTRIQHLPSITPQKVNLQIILIHKLQRRITKLISIRKNISRIIGAYSTQTFDIACSSCNNVSRSFGIVETCWIGGVVVDGVEALGVVDVAEDAEVDAVFVEEGFEGCFAGLADRSGVAGRIPGAVAGDDHPRGDGAVDGSQVGIEELELLGGCAAEGTGAESCTAAFSIGGGGEVGLGVDHNDVSHSVLERIPERWVGQSLSFLC
jgi:hypothetical protein